METTDILRLVHPALASTTVMPLIGVVVYFALQTRTRRLAAASDSKTKIPPMVGPEHTRLGRWLSAAVVGIVLVGLTHPIIKTIVRNNVWAENPVQVLFIGAFAIATIASLVLLYRAKKALWRGIFATLTGTGLVVLGCQDGVWRRGFEWWVSHYYIGMAAAMLMIFSLAILPDIYKSKTWRRVHIILNCVALLFFIGQGMTGARDLLEIPLSWQEPFVYSCDFENQICPTW